MANNDKGKGAPDTPSSGTPATKFSKQSDYEAAERSVPMQQTSDGEGEASEPNKLGGLDELNRGGDTLNPKKTDPFHPQADAAASAMLMSKEKSPANSSSGGAYPGAGTSADKDAAAMTIAAAASTGGTSEGEVNSGRHLDPHHEVHKSPVMVARVAESPIPPAPPKKKED